MLVYSTDPAAQTKTQSPGPKTSGRPYVRVEKKGRGGKAVTVIKRLPRDEHKLKSLCAELKRSLGVGGTFYVDEEGGVVELQGEHQDEIEKRLTLIVHGLP